MAGVRDFLQGKAGSLVTIVACALVVALAGYVIWNYAAPSDAAALSRDRWYVCSETLKPFHHEPVIGEEIPVESPFSGKRSGYPAEACYWTKDGKPKAEPTYVLLNMMVGKPGATFCPDCGRLVVPRNPMATPDRKAPPTKEEQEKSRAARGNRDAQPERPE